VVSAGDELVAVYDEAGAPMGVATRRRMRAEGLWHAAGVVFVRSVDGRSAYVHLRTDTKDVFPGLYDCWAGGVVAAGETPAECASRELAEELGIHGVAPVPLFVYRYDAGSVHCHNFAFGVGWDGPVTHQPEEIAGGSWTPLPELRAMLDDRSSPFVPDGRIGGLEWFRRYAGA
jgi:8-oxo-dGTP pyrophosphatase MutT (NUDIX family)